MTIEYAKQNRDMINVVNEIIIKQFNDINNITEQLAELLIQVVEDGESIGFTATERF